MLVGSVRNNWLEQRGQAAQIAALAVEAAPDGRVSDELSRQLLTSAQVISVAVQEEDFRGIILPPSIDIGHDLVTVDLRQENGLSGIAAGFGHMFAPEGRFLRILLTPSLTKDEEMEVIVPEQALKMALLNFSRTILVVSLIVSAVVGALVYFAIYRLVVRPMHGSPTALSASRMLLRAPRSSRCPEKATRCSAPIQPCNPCSAPSPPPSASASV